MDATRARPAPDDDAAEEATGDDIQDGRADGEPAGRPRLAIRAGVRQDATCPLCLEALTSQLRLDVCPGCKTIHHSACVAEFGRCATLSCRGLEVRSSVRPRPRRTAEEEAAARLRDDELARWVGRASLGLAVSGGLIMLVAGAAWALFVHV